MTRITRSRKRKKSVWQNPAVLVPVITGVVAVIVALIQVLPQLQRPEPTIPPTAVVEVQPSATATIPPPEPTLTQTSTPAIPTDTPTLTVTPTPAPASLTCLDGWWLYPGGIEFKEESREGCKRANIPELGFGANTTGFQIAKEKFRNLGIFGISSPLPENVAEIYVTVTVSTLYTAEFWVGLSNTRDLEFSGDTLMLAVDPASGSQQFLPGSIRFYKNNFDTKIAGVDWLRVDPSGGQTTKPPFVYQIRFVVDRANVDVFVNNVKVTSQIISYPRNLFIGFRNKSKVNSVTTNVTVTGLDIKTGD